jgi:hypothetical protein
VRRQGAGRAHAGPAARAASEARSRRRARRSRPAPPGPQRFSFKTLTSADFKAYFTSYFKDTPATDQIDWWA